MTLGPMQGRNLEQLAQLPVVVEPNQVMRNRAPAGYVLVRRADPQTGEERVFAVLESVARAMRLVKPRSKPPISATDWKKLKTAKRVETKAKKIAQTAGFVCRTSKR